MTARLGAITIGSSTEAGSAVFQGTVAATNITVDGGNNSAETGLVEFQNAVTATAISLDDNTGVVTATFNATNGALTVAGTIDGGSAGEATLAVKDDDANAAPDAITFSGRTLPTGNQQKTFLHVVNKCSISPITTSNSRRSASSKDGMPV